MRKIFFTPGPSELYPTLAKHQKAAEILQVGSVSHRGELFKKIFQETTENLRLLLGIPRDFHIFFTGSSLESMERIIQNCTISGSFHFINGHFSDEFYQIAKKLKKHAEKIEVPNGSGFDFSSVKIPNDSEIVCFTHNETSTGVSIPISEIYKLRIRYPKKIFVVDVVSSAPYVDMDFSKIDIAFFSVQKGFGLPAGLGVMIVSNRAILKSTLLAKGNYNVGSYHSFLSFLEKEKKYQTPETPNVLNIYLLGKVAGDMHKKGIAKIRDETDEKANIIYSFFQKHEKYRPFVKDSVYRSRTTVAIVTGGETKSIIKKLKKSGYIIGAGYGKYKDIHIRIANFPAHNKKDLVKMMVLI